MKGYHYITSKQTAWATRHNIPLISRKGTRHLPAYTQSLNENLFEPLSSLAISTGFKQRGDSALAHDHSLPHLHAIHKSSSLAVNIFHHFLTEDKLEDIAQACHLSHRSNRDHTGLFFAQQFEICKGFPFLADIDVVIQNNMKGPSDIFAVTCTFSVAYNHQDKNGFSPKYFRTEMQPILSTLPNLLLLAQSISPINQHYTYIDPTALLLQIIALCNKYRTHKFHFLYLWYDVLGTEGHAHRSEIESFATFCHADHIQFSSITAQELITTLSDEYYYTHASYLAYMSDRYL